MLLSCLVRSRGALTWGSPWVPDLVLAKFWLELSEEVSGHSDALGAGTRATVVISHYQHPHTCWVWSLLLTFHNLSLQRGSQTVKVAATAVLSYFSSK